MLGDIRDFKISSSAISQLLRRRFFHFQIEMEYKRNPLVAQDSRKERYSSPMRCSLNVIKLETGAMPF